MGTWRLKKRRLGWRAGGQDYYEPMRYLDDGRKAIALTVDDGPSPVYTAQVLRPPEKYRVTATFSIIGIEASTYPGVAGRRGNFSLVLCLVTCAPVVDLILRASRPRRQIQRNVVTACRL